MALEPKIGGLLGFAAKSGRLLLGSSAVENGIKIKKAKLVIAAVDINPKKQEILSYWCKDLDILFLCLGTKEEYGRLLRKKPIGLLAVTEEKMAAGIWQAAATNGGD